MLTKTNYKVLVNKENKIPDNWYNSIKLVKVKDIDGDTIFSEKETLKAYNKLKKSLKKKNINIDIVSIFRSIESQQKLWDDWTTQKGIEYVKKYVARPGYSEHHTGLAIDICILKDGKPMSDESMLEDRKKTFNDIHKELYKYGFILRYPREKEEITGYSYEPWHFRYIGITEAKEIYEKGITLEEYVIKNN